MKKIIEEVCLIRLLLIVLLVLYHSFAPFCGAWEPLESFELNPEYFWWIGKFTYSFMLETFTLISGWIFGYQCLTKKWGGGKTGLLIKNKVKRLIVPSIIFSIVYILLFNHDLLDDPLKFIYSVVNGAGHMWYLPMLFWCFLCVTLVENTKISYKTRLLIFSFISILSFVRLPLRLNYAMYYMIFFYGGYLIGQKSSEIKNRLNYSWGYILLIIYIISFVFYSIYLFPLIQNYKTISLYHFVLGSLILRVIHFFYAWCGSLTVVIASFYIIERNSFHLNVFWIQLGTFTFGIYIFQQFILEWLYYHSGIFEHVPLSVIPWIAFLISLALSLIGTMIMRQSKIGRFLIG